MSDFFGKETKNPEQPSSGKFTYSVAVNGLATVFMTKSDSTFVMNQLRERIRRITWLDDFGADQAHEAWRASRMCYEIASQKGADIVRLSNLSREDLDILFDFPKHWSTDRLRKLVEEARHVTRSAGPVGPIEADLMAKELVDLMES